MKVSESKCINITAPLVLLAVILVVWQLITTLFNVPMTVLPSPKVVITAIINKFPSVIWPDLWITIKDILIGYIISVPCGLLIAALVSQFKTSVKVVTPIVILLLVTPIMTLIPIFLVFMGFNTKVKIIVVLLQTMPIIILNSLTGFSNVSKEKKELMASYGCNKFQIFKKVTFWDALSQVFAGLKLGCVLSTIAAVTADIGVGQGGVGVRIQSAASTFATDTVFATVICICLVGIILFSIVSKIEQKVIAWK